MPADEIRLPAEDEPELFFTADEAGAAAEAECEAREFHTPLPPDVVEEMVQIRRKLMKFKEKKIPEIEDQLSLFINDWRSQTKDESEELKKLKDRVAVRRAQRADEDARLEAIRQEEEELRLREAEEERIRKEEEKIKRLQDAEVKRRKMIEEQSKGKDFKIASFATKKEPVLDPKDYSREPSKEEYETMRNAALSVINRPMEVDCLDKQHVHMRCDDLWKKIVKLETERYDVEDRIKRQDYDLKELKERRKQQLKQKALKLGLPPEALTGKYPPKIQVASKYERRKGLLSFGDTKGRFEGGIVEEYKVQVNDNWTKRQDVFTKKNPGEIPPWLEDMGSRLVVDDEDEPEPEVVEDIAEIEAVEGGAENAEVAEGAEMKEAGTQEATGEKAEAGGDVEESKEDQEVAADTEETQQENRELAEEGEGENVEAEAEAEPEEEEAEAEENGEEEAEAEAEEGVDDTSPPAEGDEAEDEA